MTETLTGAGRSKLRGLAMQRGDAAIVGKAGLTESLRASVIDRLRREQLIKVRLLEGDRKIREQILQELAIQCEAEIAGQTGKTGLLYRRNPELPSLI